MQFIAALSSLVLAAVTAVSAAGPTPLDVFDPPVTFPTAGAVLTSKTPVNITWDTAGAPTTISNGALLLLAQGGVTLPFILAKGFDLRAGSLEITVPYVLGNDNYAFVLFGDSGNLSPVFTINSDTPE